MRTLLTTILLMMSAVSFAEKQKQCNTYCNPANMDGSGGMICQTVCE